MARYKESYKTIKQFEGNENPLAVAKDLKELILFPSGYKWNLVLQLWSIVM